jgi:hypothetical protein
MRTTKETRIRRTTRRSIEFIEFIAKLSEKKTVLYVLEYGLGKLRMVSYSHRQSISPILCPKLHSLPCLISCM